MKDANNKLLSLGDKVHSLGRADKIFYVVEFNQLTIGVGSECNGKALFDILPSKVVKFKNQK